MDMNIKETLETFLDMYLIEKSLALAGNEGADWMCHTAPWNISQRAAISMSYKVAASVGKGNWADVPWITIFDRQVTTSAQRGYYIVYLFRSDMSGVCLSMNMGWTQFKDKYGSVSLARKRIAETASICKSLLHSSLADFSYDPIDLQTSRVLGKGYELGHICGKLYPRDNIPEDDTLVDDLRNLMGVYRELRGLLGAGDVTSLVAKHEEELEEKRALEDSRYQRDVGKAEPEVVPLRPQKKPGHTEVAGRKKWKTNPGIAKAAIEKARYQCEASTEHTTFTSRVTNKNYVEAHHLVPMEFQEEFPWSLDVEANIVCLCPNCHRLLHHAAVDEKDELLTLLFQHRASLLEACGLSLTLSKLLKLYE